MKNTRSDNAQDHGANLGAQSFEDRLLSELRQEVALIAEDRSAPVALPWRRRVSVRRAGLGLAACAAAGAAVVAVPGSPAESPAYAVEQNPDGTVELSLADLTLPVREQHELAEELKEMGVKTVIDTPPPGTHCQPVRGHDQSVRLGILASGEDDSAREALTAEAHSPDGGLDWPSTTDDITSDVWDEPLMPGDTLIIENYTSAGDDEPLPMFSFVEGEAAPCDAR